MNLSPDIESVFTQEYWEPIAEPVEMKYTGIAKATYNAHRKGHKVDHMSKAVFDDEVKQYGKEALCLAINQLIEGEAGAVIDEGEYLGGKGDEKYTLPGAVILVDRESVHYWTHEDRSERLPRLIERQRDAEIGLSAASCLLSRMVHSPASSTNVLGWLDHYSQSFYIENNSYYYRNIDIYAFLPNKKGDTSSISLSRWLNYTSGPKAVTKGRMSGDVYLPIPARVGQTGNRTFQLPGYRRIREARMLIAGKRETEKVKVQRHVKSPLTLIKPAIVELS